MARQGAPAGHRARKRFGQNFLVDEAVTRQIVGAIAPRENQAIVEIGPGRGALTALLLAHNPKLHAIELDRDLVPLLLAQFANYRGFKIHQCDALQFDFGSLIGADETLRVVGNLPYNISTPLIFHLLTLKHKVYDMHVMLQKEVVDRLVAHPGDKNYGRLSVMAQYHCQVEFLFDVPPQCFKPAPKVNSALARLVPRAKPPVVAKNVADLEHLVKTAFQQRRKTLRNGLKQLITEEQAAELGVDLSLRAENLSVRQYVELSNALDLTRR